MKSEQNKGNILVLTAGALWETIGFFATLLSNLGMNAAPVAFYRVLSSAVMLALILLIKGKGIYKEYLRHPFERPKTYLSYLHLDFNNKDDYNVIYEFVSSNMLHLHGFEWLYTLESVFFEQRLATANIALKQ